MLRFLTFLASVKSAISDAWDTAVVEWSELTPEARRAAKILGAVLLVILLSVYSMKVFAALTHVNDLVIEENGDRLILHTSACDNAALLEKVKEEKRQFYRESTYIYKNGRNVKGCWAALSISVWEDGDVMLNTLDSFKRLQPDA